MEDCLNYTFTLSFGTDTQAPKSGTIRIYPVPAGDYLRIEGEENLIVEITDLSGKIIYRKEINGNSLDLDTHDWSRGVYILTVVSGDLRRTDRIAIE